MSKASQRIYDSFESILAKICVLCNLWINCDQNEKWIFLSYISGILAGEVIFKSLQSPTTLLLTYASTFCFRASSRPASTLFLSTTSWVSMSYVYFFLWLLFHISSLLLRLLCLNSGICPPHGPCIDRILTLFSFIPVTSKCDNER